MYVCMCIYIYIYIYISTHIVALFARAGRGGHLAASQGEPLV